MRRTVVTLPGDGIGAVVLPEALRVLDAVGFAADYVHADVGWREWTERGEPLPARTIELIERHRLALFGAITSKPKREAEAELTPSLRDTGRSYSSPILGLRQRFGLDVCLRPCRSFAGNPLNFVRRAGDGSLDEPAIDVAIFRQNTEGIYAGVEWTDPPEAVRAALGLHPKFAPFAEVPGRELALTTRLVTREACLRICRAAFAYAKRYGYRDVTLCEKANVLRETSGMFEEVAREVQREFPMIELHSVNIDLLMMWLTKIPERFGVIVAGNLFGDIVSDAFAGLTGGLGFAASANLGDEVAIFEPTHGSAPRYAELDPPIVNPIAMILTTALMLDHVGEAERARRIREAVSAVVREGRVRTYDMLRLPGGPEAPARGAASTREMTDAILAALG